MRRVRLRSSRGNERYKNLLSCIRIYSAAIVVGQTSSRRGLGDKQHESTIAQTSSTDHSAHEEDQV